jgi:enoyl-CoA hydratase/carnithine racemase
MSELTQLTIDRKNSNYWRVTFNNPPLNLIDDNTIPEYMRLLELAEADQELKVIVFDSANPDFFISHFTPAAGTKNLLTPRPDGLLPWAHFASQLSKLPVVTISAIRGRARGIGSEFVLATDIRFASLEKAILSQFEIGLGLFPGGGGLEQLPRVVGRARALEIALSADDYDAATAERYGWVNRAIPDAEFENFIERFAQRVASFDKRAITEIKHLVNIRHDLPTAQELDESMKIFFSAYNWEGPPKRIPILTKHGHGTYSDLELNYGKVLGEIDFNNEISQ